jgi:hypothetical protein
MPTYRCKGKAMISEESIKEKLADLEREYVDFSVREFAHWEPWAMASQRMADGEDVKEEEIPASFQVEYRLIKTILKMEAIGKFDWGNPKLIAVFEQLTQSPFYKMFAGMITKISLRLADFAEVKTLVEVGAGRGNLTAIMLEHLAAQDLNVKLVVTDTDANVVNEIKKRGSAYPQIDVQYFQWDVREPPPDEVLAAIEPPCLTYERATILYAKGAAIENIAKVSDLVVLGDIYNYTGKLYAYDEISKRIGAYPLFYSEIKPILEGCFAGHFMFDQRTQQELNYPNTTMLIGWK